MSADCEEATCTKQSGSYGSSTSRGISVIPSGALPSSLTTATPKMLREVISCLVGGQRLVSVTFRGRSIGPLSLFLSAAAVLGSRLRLVFVRDSQPFSLTWLHLF